MLTENEFLGQVIDLGNYYGWRSWHVGMPMRPVGKDKFVPEARARGLPDLTMMREDPPQVIWAELKKDRTKKPSFEQLEFLRIASVVARGIVERLDDPAVQGSVEHLPHFTPPLQAFVWTPEDMEMIKAILSER